MLYCIQGTVTKHTRLDGVLTQSTQEIPTFFLDSDIRGIVDEAHAAKIAHSIFEPLRSPDVRIQLVCSVALDYDKVAQFECAECGHLETQTADWIAQNGSPICPKCDFDMEHVLHVPPSSAPPQPPLSTGKKEGD